MKLRISYKEQTAEVPDENTVVLLNHCNPDAFPEIEAQGLKEKALFDFATILQRTPEELVVNQLQCGCRSKRTSVFVFFCVDGRAFVQTSKSVCEESFAVGFDEKTVYGFAAKRLGLAEVPVAATELRVKCRAEEHVFGVATEQTDAKKGSNLALYFRLQLHLTLPRDFRGVLDNFARYGFANYVLVRSLSSCLCALPPFASRVLLCHVLFACLRGFPFFVRALATVGRAQEQPVFEKAFLFVKRLLHQENYLLATNEVPKLRGIESAFAIATKGAPLLAGQLLKNVAFHSINGQIHHLLLVRCLAGRPDAALQRILLKTFLEEFLRASGLRGHPFFLGKNSIYLAEVLRALFFFGFGNLSLGCFKELGTRFSGSFNLAETEADAEELASHFVDACVEPAQNWAVLAPTAFEAEVLTALNAQKVYKAADTLAEVFAELRQHSPDCLREFFKGKHSVVRNDKRIGFADFFIEEANIGTRQPSNKKALEYENYVRVVVEGQPLAFTELLHKVGVLFGRQTVNRKFLNDLFRFVTANGLPFAENGCFDAVTFLETVQIRAPSAAKFVTQLLVLLLTVALAVIRGDGASPGSGEKKLAQQLPVCFGLSASLVQAKRFVLKIFLSYASNFVLRPYVRTHLAFDRLAELCALPAFKNMPRWWTVGTNDATLLLGAFKHGLNNWDAVVADRDLGWPPEMSVAKLKIEMLTKRHKKLVLEICKKLGLELKSPYFVFDSD